jgi:hypothetical protein
MFRSKIVLILITIAVVIGLSVLIIAQKNRETAEKTKKPETAKPASTLIAQTTAAQETPQTGPEPTPSPKQLVHKKCSKCHTLTRLFDESRSAEEWKNLVPKMMAKNPKWISKEEGAIIIKYLSEGGN